MNDRTETIIIHSQRLAGTLMTKGFVLIAMDREKNTQTGKNIFLFRDSPELRQAMKEYKKSR